MIARFTLIFILIFSRAAVADTLPASSGWFPSWGGSSSFTSVGLLCAWDIALPSWPTVNNYSCIDIVQGSTTGSYKVHACPKAGGTCSDTPRTASFLTYCSTGYTKSGIPPNEVCESPACPASGTIYASGKYISFHGGHTLPFQFCSGGCQILTTSQRWHTDVILQGSTTNFFTATFHHDGTSCSPDTPDMPGVAAALPEASCAPGQSSITMYGKTKCIDPSTGLGVDTLSASQVAAAESKAAADAAAKAAENAAIAAGADASAVQAAKTQAAAQYAADNSTPDELKDPCESSDRIGCMDAGELPDAEAIGERELDFSSFAFDTYTFSGSASCPAPRVLALTSGPYTFSYQPFCDFLNVFKLIAVALSMYIAALIMMGQRTSD